MKKAAIYARYSCHRQTEQSIEGQIRVCKEYAARNDIEIVTKYIDRATSGTNDKRLNFQKMIKHSNKKQWDYVLVYKLDRFSRNKYEMAKYKKTLKDNGIKLLSATEDIPETPEGIILESVLEGMAEYYSAELSQKTKRGQRESREKGLFPGGSPPYGYKVINKKVFINEEQAEILKYIYEQHISGRYINDIIQELTDKGIYYKGKPFKEPTVRKFLHNECYTGIYKYEDEIFTNIYPAIISKTIFDASINQFKANKYGKAKKGVKFILKDRTICGYCGGKIRGGAGKTEINIIRRYYSCSNRIKYKSCNQRHIKKDLLEQVIIDTTLKIFQESEIFNIANEIVELHNKKNENFSLIKYLEQQKSTVENKIDSLRKLINKRIISPSINREIRNLKKQQYELTKQIILETKEYHGPISKESVINFINKSLNMSPYGMVNRLINKIILTDDKIEIYYNYTDKFHALEKIQDFQIYNDKLEIKSYSFDIKAYI